MFASRAWEHLLGCSILCYKCYPCPWTKLLTMSPDCTAPLANIQMEPTRPRVGANMSLRRAAQRHGVSHQEESERWQRNYKGGIFGLMSKPGLNIDDLSPEERLRLIEELWDSLNEKPESVPLTNAQREELDRRLDDLENSGPEGIPWEQVLQQIRSRSK